MLKLRQYFEVVFQVLMKEVKSEGYQHLCSERMHVPFPRLLRMRNVIGHIHFGMPVEHISNTHFSIHGHSTSFH